MLPEAEPVRADSRERSQTITQFERWLFAGLVINLVASVIAIALALGVRGQIQTNRQNGWKSRALNCEILDNMVHNPPLLELCDDEQVRELRKHHGK